MTNYLSHPTVPQDHTQMKKVNERSRNYFFFSKREKNNQKIALDLNKLCYLPLYEGLRIIAKLHEYFARLALELMRQLDRVFFLSVICCEKLRLNIPV